MNSQSEWPGTTCSLKSGLFSVRNLCYSYWPSLCRWPRAAFKRTNAGKNWALMLSGLRDNEGLGSGALWAVVRAEDQVSGWQEEAKSSLVMGQWWKRSWWWMKWEFKAQVDRTVRELKKDITVNLLLPSIARRPTPLWPPTEKGWVHWAVISSWAQLTQHMRRGRAPAGFKKVKLMNDTRKKKVWLLVTLKGGYIHVISMIFK